MVEYDKSDVLAMHDPQMPVSDAGRAEELATDGARGAAHVERHVVLEAVPAPVAPPAHLAREVALGTAVARRRQHPRDWVGRSAPGGQVAG